MSKVVIGADTETYDNLLKTEGYSWKYNQGYILCTSLHFVDTEETMVIAGLHNDNCPFTKEQREKQNETMISILKNPNVCLIGANIIYDIGWWCYEYNMTTFDVKCSFVDVLQAESILDEFNIHDLDKVSYKYLKHGKTKTAIEEWVRKTYPKFKKDFRQKLKDAPWELLCEYVKGDAKFPVQIWKKQLTLLKEQDLCKRAKLEFDCILPILQITMNGYPIDNEQREKNCELLKHYIELLKTEFQQKYNMPKFSVTKARDIASFFDKHNIPYRYKITIKGYGDSLFVSGDYKAIDSAYAKAKKLVSSFRYVKSVPVAYVPKELADRTISLLEDEGFIVISSPNIDKKVFAGLRETYPEVALIADWKLATGMVSKFLGEKYNRYLIQDKDGGYRIKGQFKITDTVSFRLSSNSPNCISGEMRVLTDKGWVKIKDLKVGDSIVNGNGDLTYVKNIWNKGVQNCLLTVSAKGNRIVTTPEHKVWTGSEEKEIGNCEQIGTIERRADSEVVQVYADKGADSGCARCRQEYSNNSAEKKIKGRRVCRTEKATQDKNCEGLYKSTGKSELCQRVYITRETLLQRLVSKIQSFVKQGKKLPEEALNSRADSRATQFEGSTGKVQEQWLYRKAEQKLQRGMFRLKRLYDSIRRLCRWEREKSIHTQKGICRSIGNRCVESSAFTGSASYRHQPLEQRLGQLGSVYSVSTQKVAQYTAKPTVVYDIEVASEDHSFICEGFRVFNCQQVPSKGGFKIHENGKEIDVSFPALTRALFHAEKGKVLCKIDYGQIEYRLICNIACGESGAEVRRQYAENPKLDFHQYTVDLTGLSRKYAKNMSFGISFGMGIASMAENFGWTREKAEEIAEQYNEHLPFVQPTLALVGDLAVEKGYIKTVCGSRARLPNPNKKYTMLNRYTQGSGAEILKTAIVQAYKEGLWERLDVKNQVHDELNMSVSPDEQGITDCYRMAEIMRTAVPSLRVPLEAEPEFGDNWANTHLVSEWVEMRDKGDDTWTKASPELKQAITTAERLLKENKISA